ncbi:MAG TPA: AbrB/MazE/SpoVT family DNA-binding domain-containing protein [Chthonomonadaceae bacterium]|nr:AbrB/MazE/SpoVT family DNA-binding domain-containing protein [Chthonomonadaceae bacterium]
MTILTIGQSGQIALPESMREHYGLKPNTLVRVIETRTGILSTPLTEESMSEELKQELAEWEALSAETWNLLPYTKESS